MLKTLIPNSFKETLYDLHFYLRPIAYLGFGAECPCCGFRWRSFVPHGRPERLNARCGYCEALERHRLLYVYLQNKTALFQKPMRLLHFAPEDIFAKIFAGKSNISYHSVDLCTPGVHVHTDITRLAFGDNTFDALICCHVLEHIPDDAAAMRELMRVLKPGGWAILQVPLDTKRDNTYENWSVTDPKERRKHFGQEDHVRVYGLDYENRLRNAGFQVTVDSYVHTLPADTVKRYGLPPDENIYFCQKPAA